MVWHKIKQWGEHAGRKIKEGGQKVLDKLGRYAERRADKFADKAINLGTKNLVGGLRHGFKDSSYYINQGKQLIKNEVGKTEKDWNRAKGHIANKIEKDAARNGKQMRTWDYKKEDRQRKGNNHTIHKADMNTHRRLEKERQQGHVEGYGKNGKPIRMPRVKKNGPY